MRLQVLLSIYAEYLLVTLAANLTTDMVTAQSMTDNATGQNLTTGTIVTNGTTLNMTNASTPVITNTTKLLAE
jgi:hypothetical protein